MPGMMLVDDEPLIREGLKRMIQRVAPDWRVIAEAANGKEAMAAIVSERPDLVVTDIVMPEMDGLAMAQALAAKGLSMPVVFFTGHDDFAYVRQALRTRAFEYLLKPLNESELVQLLDRFRRECGAKQSTADGAPATVIELARRFIREHLGKPISLADVAGYVHMNPSYFSEYFKEKTGENFIHYVTRCRMEAARDLLTGSVLRIGEIAERLGYRDYRTFITNFKTHVGFTPSEYRERSAANPGKEDRK